MIGLPMLFLILGNDVTVGETLGLMLKARFAVTAGDYAMALEMADRAVTLNPDALLTEHNSVVCAGAALAQFDLVLHLITQEAGGELARVCAKYLVLDGGRRSQAPYFIPEHLARHDALVSEAQDWIRGRLATPFSVEELARTLGCSGRTLNRRFVRALGYAPSVYIQRCRADEAARLLRGTELSIGEIAQRVGYAEEGALRKSFRRTFQSSPRSYRQRHRVR